MRRLPLQHAPGKVWLQSTVDVAIVPGPEFGDAARLIAVQFIGLTDVFAFGEHARTSKEFPVKAKIHPKYQTCNVHCACGNDFVTRSTSARINVDICSACHPFFTGKLKFVDTAGRIEKFKTKFAESGYASLKRGKKAAPAKGEDTPAS